MFEGAPIPANWEAFLRSNANKDELFRYLSDCIHACETGRKVIISTKDETIVSTLMSNISNHVPRRRQIRAFWSTMRILHDKHFANW